MVFPMRVERPVRSGRWRLPHRTGLLLAPGRGRGGGAPHPDPTDGTQGRVSPRPGRYPDSLKPLLGFPQLDVRPIASRVRSVWYRDDVRTSAYNDVRSVSAPNKERT